MPVLAWKCLYPVGIHFVLSQLVSYLGLYFLVDHEVMELLRVSYEEAKRLISSHRKALDKIAAYLIRKETITGKEFMIIFRAVEKGMEVSDVLDAEGLKALDEAVKAEDKTDEANVDTETAESTVQAPAEMPAESSGDSEDH